MTTTENTPNPWRKGTWQRHLRSALPQFVRDLIASPPRAGTGVHQWLFKVARQLHAHLPAGDIVRLLQERVANCGRSVSLTEIVSAVQSSLACAWHPKFGPMPAPIGGTSKWPKLNRQRREDILRNGRGLSDLWELSSPRIDSGSATGDLGQNTERIIDRLFPGNPLLCCGKSSREFDTLPREQWRGQLSGLQFIVPSPMSAWYGMTKDGRSSKHTLANTGPRRFLVCEFDTGSADEHALILLHLATLAPMVCAVHSGGKSLHGWFYVHGQPDAKVERFFRYAVSLGADPATWTRSQFVRMPDGTRKSPQSPGGSTTGRQSPQSAGGGVSNTGDRDTGDPGTESVGRRQTVFFLNFKPLQPQQKPMKPLN